jgi:hypothetical protein
MIFACFMLAMVQPKKAATFDLADDTRLALPALLSGQRSCAKLGHWVPSFWEDALAILHDILYKFLGTGHITGRYYINF